MTKNISILFLICYSLLLSGSMFSVGHELLHATASITGVHQHEVKQHSHGTNTHHHHHVSDHSNLFKDIFTIDEETKKFFTNMVFLSLYYEATISYDFGALLKENMNYSLYKSLYQSVQLSAKTPPPDHFN